MSGLSLLQKFFKSLVLFAILVQISKSKSIFDTTASIDGSGQNDQTFAVLKSSTDPSTAALSMLNAMLISSQQALQTYSDVDLACSGNCITTITSMEIEVLPTCMSIENVSSTAEWTNAMQTDYDVLKYFEYYLDPTEPTMQSIKSDLEDIQDFLPSFKINFKNEMSFCIAIAENSPYLFPFDPLHSDILEKARNYLYLRQFKEFLRCYHDGYLEFVKTHQSNIC